MPDREKLSRNVEEILFSAASVLAARGLISEARILCHAAPSFKLLSVDFYNNSHRSYWSFIFGVSPRAFGRYDEHIRKAWQENIKSALADVLIGDDEVVSDVLIRPGGPAEEDWRKKVLEGLKKGPTNQGRARSTNVAPIEFEGLLFRSQPEVFLYKAFKATGVTVAPLPVFIRGGTEFRRLEPDFVLLKGGRIMVVEVDGTQFHHESPVEADERTSMLRWNGAKVERVRASNCATEDLAKTCAARLLKLLDEYREQP